MAGTRLWVPGEIVQGELEEVDPAMLQQQVAEATKMRAKPTTSLKAPVYYPKSAKEATHIYLKKAKMTTLNSVWEGPSRIRTDRGTQCYFCRWDRLPTAVADSSPTIATIASQPL